MVALFSLAACGAHPQAEIGSSRKPARFAIGKVPPSEVAVWTKITSPRGPSAGWDHPMAYNPSTGKTYFFGVADTAQSFGELWAWDGKAWSQVTAGVGPAARVGCNLAYDPARKSIILYGGGSSGWQQAYYDTWEWRQDTGWAELKPAANPGTVFVHVMVTDLTRSKILLFGGYTAIGSFRNDVWEWDGAATTWTRRTPVASANVPFGDAMSGGMVVLPYNAAYDESRQKLLVYESGSAFWEWDPISAGWAWRDSGDNLGDIVEMLAMAYDPFRRRHVFLNENGVPSEIAELDGRTSTWFLRTPATEPPNLSEAAMVFDSGRNVMVLWQYDNPRETWELTVGNLANGEGCSAATAASCASGHCVDGVCCDVAACTGTCKSCNVPGYEGTCAPAQPGTEVSVSCDPGRACDAAGGCKSANGKACSASSECASGFCVDGVCCDTACAGTCVACNLSGQAGTCRPYVSGTDPENECSLGSGACKSTCDGAGSCAYPKNGKTCGHCLTCDGLGTCSSYDRTCSSPPLPDASCYVDSVNGDDGQSGLSEAEAVRSQAKIGANCTTIRYRRGSLFAETVRLIDGAKTYTNYGDAKDPLPRFVVPRTKSSGPVIQAMGTTGATFDGLYLSGATGDGTVAGQTAGACVALGLGNTLTNSEITDCDVGVILYDEGNVVEGNYIHDIVTHADLSPEVDPFLAGGSVGVVVRAPSSIVRWNTLVNCKGSSASVVGLGDCYGGATEITMPFGGPTRMPSPSWPPAGGILIDSNYSYNNCGLATMGTYLGDSNAGPALYEDAHYTYNISVDSGWMALLDVGNSTFADVQFSNNTIVQHKGTTNAGKLAVLYTPASSGAPAGDGSAAGVGLVCDLLVVDGVPSRNSLLDKSFAQQTNLILDLSMEDPGFVNSRGVTAGDYDLTASSPAINVCGVPPPLPDQPTSTDFFGRRSPDPKSNIFDVGACEYGSRSNQSPKFFPGAGGWIGSPLGTGGASGAGGTASTKTPTGGSGGTSSLASAKGGAGGAAVTATRAGDADAGDTAETAAGGAAGTTAGAAGGGGASGAGGTAGTEATTIAPAGTGDAGNTGGSTGGTTAPVEADGASVISQGGDSGSTGDAARQTVSLRHGCSCRLGQNEHGGGLLPLLGFAVLVLSSRTRFIARLPRPTATTSSSPTIRFGGASSF
jgi:hypothetical protein